MLLNLPPELIHLVLQSADTPTYIVTARTCRALYEIASTCREVVLHHLHQTPGSTVDVQHLETRGIFQILAKRSSRNLYGVEFRASSKTFEFGSHVIDVQASSLASPGDLDLAIVLKTLPDIFFFRAGNDGVFLHSERLKLPWEQPGPLEVLKTTCLGDHDVFALYRFTPAIDADDQGSEHPFVKQARQADPSGMVYLAHFDLQSPQRVVRMCSFPDNVDYEALALTVADRDIFAISWQHNRESSEYEVVLYSVSEEFPDEASDIIEISYDSCVMVDGNGQRSNENVDSRLDGSHSQYDQGPVIGLSFNDRASQLLYYYRTQTLYGSFQRFNLPYLFDSMQPKLYQNASTVPFSDTLTLRFSIDIPFFGTHSTLTQNGIEMCNWKYLSLGIATHRVEKWTVACLLKSESVCRSFNCEHVLNLDRGRRFADWTIVGRLLGYQNATSSLGCIAAASRRGTRIAVANWNVIHIWALEPNALVEENANGFYPLPSRATSPEMIELQPIALHMEGVCFELRFMAKEDELLALTDRGVVHWNLGPLTDGRKMVERIVV